MKRKTLPKRTLLLWQIRVVMLTALLISISAYYSTVAPFLRVAIFLLAGLGLLLIVWYLPVFFKSYEILFMSQSVIINYGVFIKFKYIMPYSRLIYAQTFATPLARAFGITALSLKAARSRVIIPEILNSDAQKFMSALTSEVQND